MQSPMQTLTPLSRVDLMFKDNRDQAAWELRRALDSGDDLWLARWARHWGEPAMRVLLSRP